MAITISGQNNNDKIVASDGVLDMLSGFNVVGVMTANSFDVGSNIKLGNAGIITATTVVGNVTGNLTGNINHTSNILLQISGSEKFRVGTSGQFGIAGANYGTSGQVLTSGGSGSAPTWSTISTPDADKITEGNTKAEVSDTGTNGRFFVETEGTEKFSIASTGDFIFNQCNDSVFNANGNLTLDYKISNSIKYRQQITGSAVNNILFNMPWTIWNNGDAATTMDFHRGDRIQVGTGVSIAVTGNIVATGIITAASFKNADGSDVGADLTSVDSNIVPDSDNARTIGSSSKNFVNVFTRRVEGPDSNYVYFGTNGEIQVVAKSGQALALKGGTHSRGIEIVNAGVLPSHSAVELGSASTPWNKVYAQTLHGDGSNLTGISITSDGQYNTKIGTNAGDSFNGTNATKNTLFGYDAGTGITDGDSNTFIGYEAGESATTAYENVAIGYQAGNSFTTLPRSTLVGAQAGKGSTNGNDGVGYQSVGGAGGGASGWGNSGYGKYALSRLTSGNHNTCVGSYAGNYITGGHRNTIMGENAGHMVNGNDNVIIGQDAAYDDNNSPHNTGSNCIIIGSHAMPTGQAVSNEITFGNSSINHFRIPGIGVSFSEGGVVLSGITTISGGTVELQPHMVRVGNRTTTQINAGVSTATGSLTVNTTTNNLLYYANAQWNTVKKIGNDGSTQQLAARSAKALLDEGFTSNGVYWLDMHGAYSLGNAKLHYCLMDTSYDGGGWTMLYSMNHGNNFASGSNYSFSLNVGSPTTVNDFTAGNWGYDRRNTFTPAANDQFLIRRSDNNDWKRFVVSTWSPTANSVSNGWETLNRTDGNNTGHPYWALGQMYDASGNSVSGHTHFNGCAKGGNCNSGGGDGSGFGNYSQWLDCVGNSGYGGGYNSQSAGGSPLFWGQNNALSQGGSLYIQMFYRKAGTQ